MRPISQTASRMLRAGSRVARTLPRLAAGGLRAAAPRAIVAAAPRLSFPAMRPGATLVCALRCAGTATAAGAGSRRMTCAWHCASPGAVVGTRCVQKANRAKFGARTTHFLVLMLPRWSLLHARLTASYPPTFRLHPSCVLVSRRGKQALDERRRTGQHR